MYVCQYAIKPEHNCTHAVCQLCYEKMMTNATSTDENEPQRKRPRRSRAVTNESSYLTKKSAFLSDDGSIWCEINTKENPNMSTVYHDTYQNLQSANQSCYFDPKSTFQESRRKKGLPCILPTACSKCSKTVEFTK